MSAAPPEKRSYLPADARRAQILEVAGRVFAEKGYHAASIADVCAAAGIGRGTLYQYFTDKADLLRALTLVVKHGVERLIASRAPVKIEAGQEISPEATVAFVQHRFVQFFEVIFRDAATARLVLAVGRGSGVLDDLFQEIDASVLTLIERDLRAGIDAGLLRPIDVHLAARFFLGGIERVVRSYLEENRDVDHHAIAREAAMLELYGALAPRERPTKKERSAKQPTKKSSSAAKRTQRNKRHAK